MLNTRTRKRRRRPAPVHCTLARAAACLGLAVVAMSAGWAQAAPVTLAVAVDAAWQRTQAGAAAQSQRLKADAERRAAASLVAAPPSLSLSQRSDRWQDDTGVREREIALAVPIWLPGQRHARQAAAAAAVTAAEQVSAVARLQLAGELREIAWNLASLRAEAGSARSQHRYLATLSDDVERRVKAGDLAHSDALATQGERLAAEAELIAVEQRLRAEQTRWTALTGLQGDVVAEEAADEARRAVEAANADDALADGRHPLLNQLAANEEAARRALDVANREAADAPEVSVGYRDERDGRGQPGRGSVTVALRVPFGGDVRNAVPRAAAQGALEQAHADIVRARAEVAANWRIARDALASAERQTVMQRQRAALLRQRVELLDKSFRAGETALPDLLLAAQAAAQAEAALARQQAAQGSARARLYQASGVLP
ncbi:TolC family protein [Roseateles sp.]|uniref:TolC family protein n=1 Tax=Roseateles sp. TaxID=1971397 RepID=UPI003BAC755E